jgi:NTP pyrophosphatase (non-canonical NTP hydrolase)
MTLNEYQERAMTTCMESCKNDTYMLFGLMAEVGEVADKIAKWKRKGIIRMDGDRVVFSAPPKDAGYLAEELMYEVGDIMWFCAGLARQFGWSLENVCWANLNKLSISNVSKCRTHRLRPELR